MDGRKIAFGSVYYGEDGKTFAAEKADFVSVLGKGKKEKDKYFSKGLLVFFFVKDSKTFAAA